VLSANENKRLGGQYVQIATAARIDSFFSGSLFVIGFLLFMDSCSLFPAFDTCRLVIDS
jgi:hypothetical protein